MGDICENLEPPAAAQGVWGKADLHIHTTASDGAATPQQVLDHAAGRGDLNVIAITDHDEIWGALQARELAAQGRYPLEIIVGMEVTTREGHLLALFIEQPIPMFLSLEETIERIHAQGGLCIVPHPMSWLTFSVGRRRLLSLVKRRSDSIYFDGLESFNASLGGRVAHRQALALNGATLSLAEVGGSDAHNLSMVGRALTLFPGRTAQDFRRALDAKSTTVAGHFSPVSEHFQGLTGQLWRGLLAHPSRKATRLLQQVLTGLR